MAQTPTLELCIRAALPSDLSELATAAWSTGLPEKHRNRLERQARDEASYLLAIHDDAAVGHLFLTWNGPCTEPARSLLPPCAEVEDFVVAPELRSHGIGAALLDRAAKEATERGLTRLGLAVGVENVRARSLYERSGFTVTNVPAFDVRWQYRTPNGTLGWEGERCIYMVKPLE